jgi:hypothetical protein
MDTDLARMSAPDDIPGGRDHEPEPQPEATRQHSKENKTMSIPTPDDLTREVASLDQEYAQIRPVDEIPEGRYKVEVERVTLTRSRAGTPMLMWTLRLSERVAGNRRLWRNHLLNSDQDNLHFVKRDLKLVGIHLDRLSDLAAHLDELIGIRLEISVYYRDGGQRITFKRLLP